MIHVYCSHCGNHVRMQKEKSKDDGHKLAYECKNSCGMITYISRKVPKPISIHFDKNGLTRVYDKNDHLIGEYCEDHKTAIELLYEDRIDWKEIPNIIGKPKL